MARFDTMDNDHTVARRLIANALLLISLLTGCAAPTSVANGPCCAAPVSGSMVIHLNGSVGSEVGYTHR
jgi:hypothetical protein